MLFQKPEDFQQIIGNSILAQGSQLSTKIKEIEKEIEEIGNALVKFPKDYVSNRKRSKLSLNELIQVDPRLVQLKIFYATHLYNSLEISILISLNRLAEACGYKLEMFYNQDDDFLSRLFPSENSDLTEESFANEFVRMKSFDEMIVHSAKHGRHSFLTSTVSKATWTGERALSNAFLN